jgi:hypothetical protein
MESFGQKAAPRANTETRGGTARRPSPACIVAPQAKVQHAMGELDYYMDIGVEGCFAATA